MVPAVNGWKNCSRDRCRQCVFGYYLQLGAATNSNACTSAVNETHWIGNKGRADAHLASFLREPHACWCKLRDRRHTAWHAEVRESMAAKSQNFLNLPSIHDAAPCSSNRALVACRWGRNTWPARKQFKRDAEPCIRGALPPLKNWVLRANFKRTCPAFPPSLSARPAPPPPI